MTARASAALRVAALFAGAWAYAVLRYVVFKGLPWSEVPLYVTDKAVAVTSAVLLAVALVPARVPGEEQQALRRWLGLTGAALAALHVAMTLPLFSAGAFAGLTEEGAFSARGWVAVVLGLLATGTCLAMVWRSRTPALGAAARPLLRWLGWLTVWLTAAHCVAIGLGGWWAPGGWPGTLPPITLLVVIALVAIAGLARVRRGRA